MLYQSYARNLQVGQVYEANCTGKWLSILTWGNAIDLLVSIDGESFSPIKAGMSVKLGEIVKPFYYVRFQNITGAIVLLEFAISDGQIVDSRFNAVGVVNVITPGLPAAAYGFVPCLAAAGGTLVIPANAARRSFFVQNLITNLGNHYIGFDGLLTNVNYGALLAPGMAYANDDYTGDVWAQAIVNLEAVSFIEV